MDDNTARPADESPPPPAEPAPAPADTGPPLLSIDRFMEIDLRVGIVLEAERIPKADRLLRLQVDLGNERRQIVAGIAESYEPETLVGRRIVVVANLKPARLRGVESQGMLLAGDLGGRAVLASFEEPVPPGTRVR